MLYKTIDLEQGTVEWHTFRQTHIGASETAIVMGLSPFKTARDLYLEKTGFKIPPPPSYPMIRGIKLEPLARAIVNETLGVEFTPIVVEHLEHPFISCSLDGINNSCDAILEIKCPGRANHEKAIHGEVPVHYQVQIQHQLMVTGAKFCHYASYNPEHEETSLAIIPVNPDPVLQEKILASVIQFWHHVLHLDFPD